MSSLITSSTPPADHTAAWLAFVGALAVAGIAAVTAQWRQRQQLRHDRGLKDLEELRVLFDDCARMAGETTQLMIYMLRRAIHLPTRESRVETASEGQPLLLRELGAGVEVNQEDYWTDDPTFQSLEEAFYRSARPVFGLYQRIVLRLGENDEVSRLYLELELQWVALGLSALLAETSPTSVDRISGICLSRGSFGPLTSAFSRPRNARLSPAYRPRSEPEDSSSAARQVPALMPLTEPRHVGRTTRSRTPMCA
jgi:hypothetical protein